MSQRILMLLLPLALVSPTAVAEEMPDPKEIVERVVAAAGGGAFASLGILELEVTEEEILNNGTQTGKSYKLLVDTSNLHNIRMELKGDVVVASTKGGGWSTVAGALDDRPQTPRMAQLSLRQAIFPLLLPFTLQMEGVWLKEIRESEAADGREVWVIGIPFTKGFFLSPVMETTWVLVVAKDDYSIVSLEFAPAPAFQDVSPVGVRYRILTHEDLNDAKLAKQLLSIGINPQYQESGASRVTKIKSSVRGPWDPTLFLSPAQLEAIEED